MLSAVGWFGAALTGTAMAAGLYALSEFIERAWGRRCPACDSHRLRRRSTPGSWTLTLAVLVGLVGIARAFDDPAPWLAVGLPIAIVLAACAVVAATISMFRTHHCRACGHRWR